MLWEASLSSLSFTQSMAYWEDGEKGEKALQGLRGNNLKDSGQGRQWKMQGAEQHIYCAPAEPGEGRGQGGIATVFIFACTCTDHFWKEAQGKSRTGLPSRRAAEWRGPGKTALYILFCTFECLYHANGIHLY